MTVKTTCQQVITLRSGGWCHQVDAHASCRVVVGGCQHHQRIACSMKRLDQKRKPNGFNPVVVGEKNPSLLLSHDEASFGAVLIVRFIQGGLFGYHHRHEASHQDEAVAKSMPQAPESKNNQLMMDPRTVEQTATDTMR